MKKIYIKPEVLIYDNVLEVSILQSSIDNVEEDGNMGVEDGEDFAPEDGQSKGGEFDPWGWSFRDDLLW